MYVCLWNLIWRTLLIFSFMMAFANNRRFLFSRCPRSLIELHILIRLQLSPFSLFSPPICRVPSGASGGLFCKTGGRTREGNPRRTEPPPQLPADSWFQNHVRDNAADDNEEEMGVRGWVEFSCCKRGHADGGKSKGWFSIQFLGLRV